MSDLHTLVWRTAALDGSTLGAESSPAPSPQPMPFRPDASGLPSGAAPGFPVARGKLAPPQLAFEPVMPRAAELLLGSTVPPKLVAVCAPAGYGKTVLLSRLHHRLSQRRQRCLWITLDDRDVAVNSLVYLLQASLASAGIAIDTAEQEPLRHADEDPGTAADRLLLRLERLEGPTTLFVDNLGFCTDPLLPPLLDRLIFGSMPSLRLVLSATDRLPLDATRAKLELDAVELGASHLAFDADSTERCLRHAGVDHTPATVQRVLALTEGWPAAVRLVQILMAGAPEAAGVLARFSGDDADVANVLTRRVLAGFDPALVSFLLEIAPLREFCEELAVHATGRPEAAAWIAQLLRRNVLVFPLDRDRHWLRMHTLLRQYLLAESRRRLAHERRREVLERAAQWHADHGDEVAALEAALEAPAPMLAARMLDRVSRAVVGAQGRLGLYIGWVEQLLGYGVTLSLEAHTWYVWSLGFTLQYERAHRAMEALDHRLAAADPQGQLRGLQVRLGLLRVVVSSYLDLMDTASDEARRWLVDAHARDPLAIATVAAGAVLAEIAHGHLAEARRFAVQADAAISRCTSSYGHAWAALVRACLELRDGDPQAADRVLTQARQTVVANLGEDAGVVGTIDFVHARALLDLGRTEAGRSKALAGLQRAGGHGICETAIHGLAACVALWDGSDEGPFSPDMLDQTARRYPPRVQRTLATLQVRRLLVLGRPTEALALARRQLLDLPSLAMPLPADCDAFLERLVAIELAAGGDVRQSLDPLEALRRATDLTSRPREAAQLQLQLAEVHLRAVRLRLAVRAFDVAIAAAARRHLVQPFVERGALLRDLLGQANDRDLALTHPDELAFVARLRTLVGAEAPVATTAPVAPLEALTAREMQLLELLDQGLSNQQIADRTTLSLPTVKWHFYNLYAKLQVKSRAAATARARGLGIIRG